MGGEVVEFAGLEAERFGEKADLEVGGGFALLAKETEESAPMKRGHIADDGGVLREFGDLTRVSKGVVEITGGVDQF